MKFLIIRFSSIGDIVLTTPVVRCLKRQVATAEVHYLTKKAFRPILEANPYIDKIHCLEDDLSGIVAALREEDFDYVIDLHHNLRTLRVKRALGKKSFSFDKLNIEKWWYTNFKWNRMPDRHIVDRYMDTVASFGVKNDGAGLDYFIPAADELAPGDIPTSHQAGYVGLVLGAALATKKLPFHKLQEVCERTEFPVVLLGGPEDAEVGERLAAIDPVRIYNSCGKFNLNESAALVRQARVVVTHDTYYGPNYLANFMGGEKGLPYDIMEVKGLSCRPCSKIGYKKCPKGHFKCMEEQDIEKIVKSINPWR
jgi:ADP-heptose:LPS heptosyltransferase